MGIALWITEQLNFDQIMAPGRKKTQKIKNPFYVV